MAAESVLKKVGYFVLFWVGLPIVLLLIAMVLRGVVWRKQVLHIYSKRFSLRFLALLRFSCGVTAHSLSDCSLRALAWCQ